MTMRHERSWVFHVLALGVVGLLAIAVLVLASEEPGVASLPLGTYSMSSKVDQSCPVGSTCSGMEVRCPSIPKAMSASLSVRASDPATGTVVFLSDGAGTKWWSAENPEAAPLLASLQATGMNIVQIRWGSSWISAPTGSRLGPAILACRSATAIRAAYTRVHVPLELPHAEQVCGYCVVGSGWGAAQAAYALSHYGQDDIIQGVVLVEGPTPGALAKSCLGEPAHFVLPEATRGLVDRAYGFIGTPGPCAGQDPTWGNRWLNDAITTGGNDFLHPGSNVTFLVSEHDVAMQSIAADYAAALAAAGTPTATHLIETQTRVAAAETGRAAIAAALTATHASPTPPPPAWHWPYDAPAVGPGLPLGSVQPVASSGTCPEGAACETYTVDCPGLEPARFMTATTSATGDPKSMLLLYTGGAGASWWSEASTGNPSLVPRLQDLGYSLVQIRWVGGMFSRPKPGFSDGPVPYFCRTATAARFIHDYLYAPSGILPTGPCGFCLSGNSGGANQISYMLAFYGLDGIIDGAVPTGGPPYGALAKSCMDRPGEEAYRFQPSDAAGVDIFYGYPIGGNGPCVTHDVSFVPTWTRAAISTGGTDFLYPATTVHFMVGEKDRLMLNAGHDYYQRILDAGGTDVRWEVISGATHNIWAAPAGREAWMRVMTSLI